VEMMIEMTKKRGHRGVRIFRQAAPPSPISLEERGVSGFSAGDDEENSANDDESAFG